MSNPKSLEAIAQRVLLSAAAVCPLALATGTDALSDDPPKAGTAKSKPMNMDEPMAGEMKKEGMKKGDVKKAAEKKDSEIRKMIEKEQQSAGTLKK